MYVDLITNLSLLIAITVVSGFISQRWRSYAPAHAVMQGALFGSAAAIGMLRPVLLSPGIIFDGRSVVISLCALFFGPLAAGAACVISVATRLSLGGDGALTGALVILGSAATGVMARRYRTSDFLSTWFLWVFGLAVHLVMLFILVTLPGGALSVLYTIAVPILVLFPIATVLAGRVLATQEATIRSVAALRDAQARLEAAVRAGGVGLWDRDLNTNQVFFSPEWKGQIGYADHEIRNDLSEWIDRIHPDDREALQSRIEAYLQSSELAHEFEYRFRHRDGSYRRILSRGSKLLDEQGVPIRVLGAHVDITERAEMQAQVLQSQKMETVGQLAGGIAHDFNNLLTVINGTADLALVSLKEKDPLRDDLNQIKEAGDRAATLTRQLLAFSRKQMLAPQVIHLGTLVRTLSGMLTRLLGDEIELRTALADSGRVRADPGQLEQVIMNLAVNARDAMPQGGTLTIETRDAPPPPAAPGTASEPRSDGRTELIIRDTGAGMDDATRARIFEPFFTTKAAGQGTGLGLAMVDGIVKQSGGTIEVESAPGRGTEFRIYLPQVDAPAALRPATPTGAAASRGETILVVEDEDALRQLATRILQGAGYRVLHAKDGPEALALLEERRGTVQLVLTDLVLPGMSGRELGAAIAAAHPSVRVLYTSGYSEEMTGRGDGLGEGNHFIAKPYSKAALTEKVREVLG